MILETLRACLFRWHGMELGGKGFQFPRIPAFGLQQGKERESYMKKTFHQLKESSIPPRYDGINSLIEGKVTDYHYTPVLFYVN